MTVSKKNIHYFDQKTPVSKPTDRDSFGIRGRRAIELVEMNLPVLPGLIFDASVAGDLESISFDRDLAPSFEKFAEVMGKRFANPEHPQLMKIVISSNLAITDYPMLHNLGLAMDTIEGFSKKVGVLFSSNELIFLMKGFLAIEKNIAELQGDEKAVKLVSSRFEEISALFSSGKNTQPGDKLVEKYRSYMPAGFFDSAKSQMEVALRRVSLLLKLDTQNDCDTAIMVQPMVYGNYTKDSCSGVFATRHLVTGAKVLYGFFYAEKFDELFTEGVDINKIDASYLKELQKIAWRLEDTFKEIRQIRFTIENKKLWLVDQRSIEQKSTASQIQLLLDLNKRKIIDETELVRSFKPEQLSELLHPVIDIGSVKKLPKEEGGISGAPGAAVGRVYFSTEALMEAQHAARQKSLDDRCILLMPATYAGDVKAIEVAAGVLSCEGGYSAHASVVARQYGKISLVRPDMKITGKKAKIGDMVITEGEYITLFVPYYGKPAVFKGEGALSQPDPQTSGILDIISVCKKYLKDFTVRANADSPQDAEKALLFGADGIGLCRTEHMFFHEDRINVFRQMIISGTPAERKSALSKLQKMQTSDFYKIFKVMAGRKVTIRLLDAPLHEFLPHNAGELAKFMEFLEAGTGKNAVKLSKAEVSARIDALEEFNPMLGHRGCRIAVSYPEIYEMQVRAIFEAVCKLRKEKVAVSPEIMVPIIMNANELKLIVYGKKIEGHTYLGLADIAAAVFREQEVKPFDYEIGTMIELPCAALAADEIARYAQFFSFGTNDLTQTTLGLSRDDFNSFMPDYTMYDLVDGNPFAVLNPRVKELIAIAVNRGTSARPDLVKGLCGEHGARPENIKFCMDTGLQYVSCSAYSVPIALLSAAQISLDRAASAGSVK